MSQFDGQCSLMFVMPAPSRAFFRTLSPADQVIVRGEVNAEIAATVDVDQLGSWTSKTFTADENGMKPEADTRQELALLIQNLGSNGNSLSLPDDQGPVTMDHDKQMDCGTSFHTAYAVHIARPWEPGAIRPWIIASRTRPEIVFEIRVEASWVIPAQVSAAISAKTLVPVARVARGAKKPSARRRSVRKVRRARGKVR